MKRPYTLQITLGGRKGSRSSFETYERALRSAKFWEGQWSAGATGQRFRATITHNPTETIIYRTKGESHG